MIDPGGGTLLAGLVVVLLVGALMVVGVGPVLRRLPEPAPIDPSAAEPALESDPATPPPGVERQMLAEAPKTPYRELATTRFVFGCALLAIAAAVVVVLSVSPRFWPSWLILCTLGVLLACIDGVTTWLPWRLTWPGWLAMLLAGLLSVLLGAGWGDLLRLIGAGLIAWLWYLVVYLLTRRRLGLGDVWLAPLIGAPAGVLSFTTLYLALLLGALIGGLHGVVLVLRRRRGAFPYAPSIVIGGILAPAVSQLIR